MRRRDRMLSDKVLVWILPGLCPWTILVEIGTIPGWVGEATYRSPNAGTRPGRPGKSRLQKAFTLVKILPRIRPTAAFKAVPPGHGGHRSEDGVLI
jgi:hypothetical protein